MSTSNSTFSERVAVVGAIDPDAYTASASYDKLTDAIDMSKWNRVAFIVMAGDVADTATVDLKITEADTAGGSYSDLAGKAITQLTTDDDDKQAVVEVRADELGAGKRFLKGALRTATAASDAAVIVLGIDARIEPASDNDLASVDEIVT
jgi:hypothetical protein